MPRNKALDALLGVAIADIVSHAYDPDGDTRDPMAANPAMNMVGPEEDESEEVWSGEYNLPIGAWPEIRSLTFCLAQALVDDGYSLKSISRNFIRRRRGSY